MTTTTTKGGPTSAAGKIKSSMNALKHGITSKKWLSGEDVQRFHKVHDALLIEFNPQTPTEALSIETLANIKCKLARLDEIENAEYAYAKRSQPTSQHRFQSEQLALTKHVDGDGVPYNAQHEYDRLYENKQMPRESTLNTLMRQQTMLNKQYIKELEVLIRMQQIRRQEAVKTIDVATTV